jgi:predicted molibdopterin-dependent oxidoreductase YjgC
VAQVSSRRGSVTAPVHVDETLRKGLAFMTLHFPDQVETNVLTLDAWDPKSGTAEFKATAIRVDRPDADTDQGRATSTMSPQAAGGSGGSPPRINREAG